MVIQKLKEDGRIRLWEEYEVLRRKFELDMRLKNKIKARNEKDWEEEVYRKRELKCCKLAKNGTGWRDM